MGPKGTEEINIHPINQLINRHTQCPTKRENLITYSSWY